MMSWKACTSCEDVSLILELYDMEIHQKILKLDYQKLKTVLKRSIDQKLRSRNFDARNENAIN